MGSNDKKSRSKAAALAMVVSMVIANPLIETGCEPSQPKIIVDEDQLQQDKDKDQNNGGTVIYGGGHGSSPFIFHSYSIGSSSGGTGNENSASSGSWKSWTAPSSDGSYSGIHMSGFSS